MNAGDGRREVGAMNCAPAFLPDFPMLLCDDDVLLSRANSRLQVSGREIVGCAVVTGFVVGTILRVHFFAL